MSDGPKKTVTVRGIRNRMIILYTIVILVGISAGIAALYLHLRSISSKHSGANCEALSLRVAEAVDSFCENAESDCSNVFKNETVMGYDPVLNDYPGYESTRIKNEVNTILLELAAGKNYNDFFVVYDDSLTAGKVSVSADDFMIKRIVHSADDLLGEKNDSWLYSPSGSTRKLYYIRRISSHSHFVLSTYSEVLEPLICPHPTENTKAISVILTDSDNRVILSSDTAHREGERLAKNITERFETGNETSFGDQITGTVITARCGWKVFVMTEEPLNVTDSAFLAGGWIFIAGLIVFVSILTGFGAVASYADADIDRPDSEYTDPISGRLNEYGLDEKISELIETSLIGSTYAFIIVGVKDYKTIRQTVSLSFRKSMVTSLVKISEGFFAERRFYIGRISGDRIVLFVEFTEFDLFKAHDNLKKECTDFGKEFTDFTAEIGSSLKLGVNVGVSIYPDHAEDYDTLLSKAESAFDIADKQVESCCAVYSEQTEKMKGDGKK